MANLNLNTVELTSTLRTAPFNGAPSSSDFNEGQRETLVDLASLTSIINTTLLPLLNALSANSLLPIQDPVGIEGRTIWTDTSDQNTLFFDSLSNVPLSIADSIRILNGIITSIQQALNDQGVEVASLQARLASTNQNDISLALQSLSASLNQLTVNQQNQAIQIAQFEGAIKWAISSTAISATLSPEINTLIKATSGVSGITLTLPISTTCPGASFSIKKIDSAVGTVQIIPAGSDTIDGLSNYTLINQNQFVLLISDGAGWTVAGGN